MLRQYWHWCRVSSIHLQKKDILVFIFMSVLLSTPQRVALLCLQMIFGLLSLLSSLTIMFMILISKKKLSVPFRRLIFGLSLYDVIYSFAHVVTWVTLPSTNGVTIGNQETCTIQGCIKFIGNVGSPMYSASLCINYACVIILSMKMSTFETIIEPFLHIIPLLWSLIGATYLSIQGFFNINPNAISCGIQPYPSNCVQDETIPCQRGKNFMKVKWIVLVIPIISVYVLITLIMILIYWTVKRQEWNVKKYSFEYQRNNTTDRDQTILCNQTQTERRPTRRLYRTKNRVSQRIHSVLSTKSKKTRAVFIQSMLYVFAFLITWIFPLIQVSFRNSTGLGPYLTNIAAKIFNPAQGVINMLVYTRPSILSLRKFHPEYSWWKAFITVVKSGGDNDGTLSAERHRRHSRHM